MIRIIYTWRVAPEKLVLFTETWEKKTNKIHDEVKGAKGSFMLQNNDDLTEIRTIARWDSLNDWKHFWKDSNPSQMQSMQNLGERISVEIFEEVDDFTK